VFVGLNRREERPYVELKAFYDNDTMDQFWGIGPDSDEDDESDFGWERWGGRAAAGVPPRHALGGILWGEVHTGWERSFIHDGADPKNVDAIERFPEIRDDQREFWNGGGFAGIDLRDSPGHPLKGFLVRGEAAYWDATDGGDESWTQLGGEAQAHVPLGSEWYVLSARATVSKIDPGSGTRDDEIPFQYLPALGGSNVLRGYESWRWRDLAAAYASVELRYRVWQEHLPPDRLDRAGVAEASLFFDVGDVADDLDGDITDDLEVSYGFMLRMYLLNAHVLGLGVAHGEEGPRFLVTTDDPW